MEWMNDLFVSNAQPADFRPDNDDVGREGAVVTVRERRDDLSGVLNELKPDAVVVVEGPNRDEELQLFFDVDVNGDWKTKVQHTSGSTQDVGIAVRVDLGKFEDPPFDPTDTNNMPAFDPFNADTDGDGIEENHKFERRPLYVEVKPQGGKPFRILGLHLKSKLVYGAYEWSKWWQLADANRKKLLAQTTQLRLKFLDPFLTQNATSDVPLIVCGDVNDGPGMDASEKRLFGSAMERLMGTVWKPDLCLGNALFDALKSKQKAALDFSSIVTASFKDPIFDWKWQRVWLDHVLYSRSQGQWVTNAKIHEVMAGGQKIWAKYRHSSDHFPISVKVTT